MNHWIKAINKLRELHTKKIYVDYSQPESWKNLSEN